MEIETERLNNLHEKVLIIHALHEQFLIFNFFLKSKEVDCVVFHSVAGHCSAKYIYYGL